LCDFLQRFLGESRLLCEEQMKLKNDAELVHLARAGNRDAYDELIRQVLVQFGNDGDRQVSGPLHE
jgi:hypothetical protein